MNDPRSTATTTAATAALLRQLQAAYSGELAAAHAYHGHWRSLRRPHELTQRGEVRYIEQAEWHHRRLVGDLLAELGSGPSALREAVMGRVGRTLGALCHVSGWFLPMLFAGKLEAINVDQYAAASKTAVEAGRAEWVPLLEAMTEEEARHEAFFAGCVRSHRLAVLARLLGWRLWSPDR